MPVSEYDQRILGITKELCLQLNIADYNPIFVSWEGFDSRSRVPVEFRYDECLIERNCVNLSAKMKDVLEPEVATYHRVVADLHEEASQDRPSADSDSLCLLTRGSGRSVLRSAHTATGTFHHD